MFCTALIEQNYQVLKMSSITMQSSKYYVDVTDINNKKSIAIVDCGNVSSAIFVFQYGCEDIKFGDNNIYYIKFMHIGKVYYVKFIRDETDDSMMAVFVDETKENELSDKFMIQNNIVRSVIRICSSMFETLDDLDTRTVTYSISHEDDDKSIDHNNDNQSVVHDDDKSEASTNVSETANQLSKILNIPSVGIIPNSNSLNNTNNNNNNNDNTKKLNNRIAELRKSTSPISYVKIAEEAIHKEVPKERIIKRVQSSEYDGFINNYERLMNIFKEFVQTIPESKYPCHDFKIHLAKLSKVKKSPIKVEELNDLFDILEHNLNMIDKINKIKKIYPDGNVQGTFFEWVCEYIKENYPELGAMFGRYNDVDYSKRQFIVYKLDDDNMNKINKMTKHPSMDRTDEFRDIEIERTIKTVLDVVNNLEPGFEPFEVKSIDGLYTVLDLFYKSEVRTGILNGVENKDMIYIDFNFNYPSTPLVTYHNNFNFNN